MILTALSVVSLSAETYYLNNDNTTYSNDWKKITISQISENLNSGNKILFKCTNQFECDLTVDKSNITIGAYYDDQGQPKEGVSGNLPEIKGSVKINQYAEYVNVENLELYPNSNSTGIDIYSSNCHITGCDIHDFLKDGISIHSASSGCRIEKNILHQNQENQVKILGGDNHHINYNFCYNENTSKDNGIYIHIIDSGPSVILKNYKIFGNCIANSNIGINIVIDNQSSSITNSYIYNNTVVKGQNQCISIAADNGNINIKNNIFFNPSDNSDDMCEITNSPIGIFDNNIWHPTKPTNNNCSGSSDKSNVNPFPGTRDWTKLSSFALTSQSTGAIGTGVNDEIPDEMKKYLECDISDGTPPKKWETRTFYEDCQKQNPDIGADIYCPGYCGIPETVKSLKVQ